MLPVLSLMCRYDAHSVVMMVANGREFDKDVIR
jgi:hypothetical protein